MELVEQEVDGINLEIDYSDDSSSIESSSESSQFQREEDDRYVFNYPPNPTKLYYPRNLPSCPQRAFTKDRHFDRRRRKSSYLSNDSLTGEQLYYNHGLVLRVEPLPPITPDDIRLRNNNSRKVATHNHSSYDYVCHLEGGRFIQENGPQAERNHHFGPSNHFGNVNRSNGNDQNAINDDGVTRFGPNFARPVEEFFENFENDEIPTIEIKQTVTTKYAINNEGLVYTGTVKEVNVWGSHPHEDNLRGQEEEN